MLYVVAYQSALVTRHSTSIAHHSSPGIAAAAAANPRSPLAAMRVLSAAARKMARCYEPGVPCAVAVASISSNASRVMISPGSTSSVSGMVEPASSLTIA